MYPTSVKEHIFMAPRSLKSDSPSTTIQEPSQNGKAAKTRQRRRKNGEGSINQRADGRWEVQISTGDGRRKSLYGKTEKEVRMKLKEAQRLLDQGKPISYPRQKVRDYFTSWLGVQKLKVKLTTFTNREVVIRTRINPALGNLLLAQLTTAHVQGFIQVLVDDKLSPSYIRLIFRVLNTALNHAVKLNMIPQNPCKHVTLPRQEKRAYQVLDQQQAQRLLQELQGHKLEWLITLALVTGMRRGELLALHWKDVDLVHGSLQVQYTATFLPGAGYQQTDPKTASSKRGIALPAFVVEGLKAHRTQQLEQRLQARSWKDNDLVFPNRKGGYLSVTRLQYTFKAILQKSDIQNMRFHDLRHSAATILLMMKVPPKVVQELLGHSSIKITMDLYGHAFPSMQQEAMGQMSQFLQVLGGENAQMAN
jgi:integrase